MKITRIGQGNPTGETDDLLGDIVREMMKPVPCSKDCVQALLGQFPGTVAKDWKRRSKKKDPQGRWVRRFENSSNGASADITEDPSGGFMLQVIQGPAGGHGPTGHATNQTHQGGLSFLPLVPPMPDELGGNTLEEVLEDWTGRMVYDREEDDDDEIAFGLGPETKDGYMDDTWDGGACAKLGQMFADFECNIMAAENYHMIKVPAFYNGDNDAFWQVVEQRLVQAGAAHLGSNPTGTVTGPEAPIYYAAQIIHLNNLEDMGAGDPDLLGFWHVCITSQAFWNQYHCMDDSTPPWVQIILDDVGFPPEDMENSYTLSPAQMQAVRQDQRFHECSAFKNFLESH